MVTGVAVVLGPKCALCVAGYFVAAMNAGVMGREFCGGLENGGGVLGAVQDFAAFGVALAAVVAGIVWLRRRRGRASDLSAS